METLSIYGRQVICKLLNIGSKDSIFVTDEKAFLDRINLLRVYKNTDSIINTYLNEVSKYENEEAYVEAINEAEHSLYSYLESMIEIKLKQSNSGNTVDDMVYKSLETPASTNMKNVFNNKALLRIYFDKPVFNIMRFIFKDTGLVKDVYDTFENFVMHFRQVEILKYMSDLDLDRFKPSIRTYIISQILDLNSIIINDLVPKYINGKHLVCVNNDGVIFESSPNKPIKSVNDIRNVLVRYNESYMLDVNIELYKYTQVDDIEDLSIKYDLMLDKVKTYDIDSMSEVDKIRYLRHIYKEDISEYDYFLKIGNYDMKIVQNI